MNLKKTVLIGIIAGAFLITNACHYTSYEDLRTIDEIAQPWIDIYGPAEDINYNYDSGFKSWEYWWWTKGKEITFTYYAGQWSSSFYSFLPIN